MASQQVIQFEYQQSLSYASDRSRWSESISVAVRIMSEAITSGWYCQEFGNRGNDFVILISIAMHARPLKGSDLELLIKLNMASPDDEGRLYARVSDKALADELGMNRITISRATERLAADEAIKILQIPEHIVAFRDSHGQFKGTKVFLLSGDIQNQFIEKEVGPVKQSKKHRVTKSSTVGSSHRVTKSNNYATEVSTNRLFDSDLRLEEEEKENPTPSVDKSPTPREKLHELVKTLDSPISMVVAEFANRCNNANYYPTPKEIAAVQNLISEGFQLETEILAGISKAFEKAKTPPNTLMYVDRVVRQNRIEASSGYTKPPANQPLIIDPDLVSATEILTSASYEISEAVLARLRLMAERSDQAARVAGSTGVQWLTDALRTALGVSKNGALINYADSVLDSWIQNGKQQPQKKTQKRGKNEKPTVAARASGSTRWPSDVG